MRKPLSIFILQLIAFSTFGQEIVYPYPVKYFSTVVEKYNVKMAYMDISDGRETAETIVLLHGKNFSGFYWKDVIPGFLKEGYRVIVPDQVGWGKSSRPDIHYSFHMLANNTKLLLDSLGIRKVNVLGHSMGGMLATRFALMFPGSVKSLVLENPIGLEDYKTFVPYKTINALFENERNATYDSYKRYQQSYYPVWKEEYAILVKAQAADLTRADFPAVARVNAITYQMIYEQPVLYEFNNLTAPVLLIIGQADRTVVGKNSLADEQKNKHGNYPMLGRKVHQQIPGSQLIELQGVGHIPHIQTPGVFLEHVKSFIKPPVK